MGVPQKAWCCAIGISRNEMGAIRETLDKSFDWPRTNGKGLISFVVSPSTVLRTGLSNALLSEVEGHERNQLAGMQPFDRLRANGSWSKCRRAAVLNLAPLLEARQ